MTEEKIPLKAHGLTQEERELLLAFVHGSAFPVYRKMLEDALVALYRQMDVVTQPTEIFRLQGRIQGIRYCLNSPIALTSRVDTSRVKQLNQDERDKAARKNPSPKLP